MCKRRTYIRHHNFSFHKLLVSRTSRLFSIDRGSCGNLLTTYVGIFFRSGENNVHTFNLAFNRCQIFVHVGEDEVILYLPQKPRFKVETAKAMSLKIVSIVTSLGNLNSAAYWSYCLI